jgi:hypothetical protein
MNKGNKKSNFNIMKTPIGDSPEQSRLNPVHQGSPDQVKTLTLHNINEHQKELLSAPNSN